MCKPNPGDELPRPGSLLCEAEVELQLPPQASVRLTDLRVRAQEEGEGRAFVMKGAGVHVS